MSKLAPFALVLALMMPAAGVAQVACPCDVCKCQAPKVHPFGVDWDPNAPRPLQWQTESRLNDFLDRWMSLPERVESAVYVGAVAGGLLGSLVVGSLALVVLQAKVKQ